jgi:AraC family transcriptional regulator of adaptative response/methylated-DNA-[protein]-cysteine methyltransferase
MYVDFVKPTTTTIAADNTIAQRRFAPATLRQFWKAVAARDHRYDGIFLYAVRSTRIYCRPSCPARRPRPEQVLFFQMPEIAESKGFRPCLRCRPREDSKAAESRLVTQACRLLEHNTGVPIRVANIARTLDVTPVRLQKIFRRFVGIAPQAYAQSIRLRKLKKRLREEADVTTALYDAGYGSSSRLYERSNSQLGMTPGVYGRGGKGMQISYTTASSSLGRVLLAATTKGVAAIYLGDSDASLEAALHREYFAADIRKHPAAVSGWLQELVRHIAGDQPELSLPVDVKATAFQRRVWEALQRIPRGQTQTYSQLAESVGLPKGRRAVARACATNPVSVLIPCHRAVRQDGGLGGYRWGIERKRKLLELEKTKQR